MDPYGRIYGARRVGDEEESIPFGQRIEVGRSMTEDGSVDGGPKGRGICHGVEVRLAKERRSLEI
jgi:hypothetical protein